SFSLSLSSSPSHFLSLAVAVSVVCPKCRLSVMRVVMSPLGGGPVCSLCASGVTARAHTHTHTHTHTHVHTHLQTSVLQTLFSGAEKAVCSRKQVVSSILTTGDVCPTQHVSGGV